MRDLSIEMARWLTTADAEPGLTKLADRDLGDRSTLVLLKELGETYTPDQAAALLDQARLRQRGVAKFGASASRMLFVAEALEQASGQAIARYRASRYSRFAEIADLGCGIGGDAVALSLQAASLLAVDLDPVRLLFAGYNLHVAGGSAIARLLEADWTALAFDKTLEAAFADPARRVEGRRVFSLHQMQPPLSAVLTLQKRIPNLGIKVMPGVPDEELPAASEVEFISEGGTCKEGVLWFGALRHGAARSATVISEIEGAGISTAQTLTSAQSAPSLRVTLPRAYLWEPDPCVIRASLIAQLARQLDASQIDEQIAYLTTDQWCETPFARAWPVIEHLPFNLKELNRRLRALDANIISVKKRGSPIEPEQFRKRLKGNPKGRPVTVFVTRHYDKPWALVCGEEVRG